MPRGGSRPGAGRKKGLASIESEKSRELLIKRVTEQWSPLIQAQIDLALGVLVEEVNPVTGETQVYSKPPDRGAGEYLINQVIGKPIERIGDPDGNAMPFTLIIKRTDDTR